MLLCQSLKALVFTRGIDRLWFNALQKKTEFCTDVLIIGSPKLSRK